MCVDDALVVALGYAKRRDFINIFYRTRIARILRIFTDFVSVQIRVISVIRVLFSLNEGEASILINICRPGNVFVCIGLCEAPGLLQFMYNVA